MMTLERSAVHSTSHAQIECRMFSGSFRYTSTSSNTVPHRQKLTSAEALDEARPMTQYSRAWSPKFHDEIGGLGTGPAHTGRRCWYCQCVLVLDKEQPVLPILSYPRTSRYNASLFNRSHRIAPQVEANCIFLLQYSNIA